MLWSINDRLGGGPGLTMDRLADDWLDDLMGAGLYEQGAFDDPEDRDDDDDFLGDY